jgi:NadR type nicotinamide-nucleotide adenylyltransferase
MPLKKIVVIGPESTGKSALCALLAQHYGTVWCPEYARLYLEEKGSAYTAETLLTIAKGQIALENAYGEKAKNDMLFIDTDMYVMKVWSEFVFDTCHPWILHQIVERKYNLYLLCDVDIPWVKDNLREYPQLSTRQTLYQYYKDILTNQTVPWTNISGAYDNRLQQAIAAVNHYMAI